MTDPSLQHRASRLVNDDGSLAAATFASSENGTASFDAGTAFRWRAQLDEVNDRTNSAAVAWQIRTRSATSNAWGGWGAPTTNTGVARWAATTRVSSTELVNQRLSNAPAGTYEAELRFREIGGTTAITWSFTKHGYTESEACLTFSSTAPAGTQVQARLWPASFGTTATNYNLCTATAVAGSVTYTRVTDLDALLEKQGVLRTTLVGGLLQRQALTETTQLDSVLQKLFTLMAQADAVIQKLGDTVTTQADALLEKSETRATQIDALVVLTGLLTAQLDALLQRAVTTDTQLDGLLQASGLQLTQIDAVLSVPGVNLRNTLLDALLEQQGVTKQTQVDALLQTTASIATQLDALLQANVLADTQIDGLLQKAASRVTQIDAALRMLDVTAATKADAVLTIAGAAAVTIATFLDALLVSQPPPAHRQYAVPSRARQVSIRGRAGIEVTR